MLTGRRNCLLVVLPSWEACQGSPFIKNLAFTLEMVPWLTPNNAATCFWATPARCRDWSVPVQISQRWHASPMCMFPGFSHRLYIKKFIYCQGLKMGSQCLSFCNGQQGATLVPLKWALIIWKCIREWPLICDLSIYLPNDSMVSIL